MFPDFLDGRALCLGVVCMGRVIWDGACSQTLLQCGDGVLALAEACSRRRKAAKWVNVKLRAVMSEPDGVHDGAC